MTGSKSPQLAYMDMLHTTWTLQAIKAALDLGVPDALGDQPRSSAELAEAVHANPAMLYRLLRALAANGIFIEHAAQRFAHNDLSQQLRADAPSGVRDMMQLHGLASMQRAWLGLAEGMTTGQVPFELANGAPLFKYLARQPRDAEVFNKSMVAFTQEHAAAVVNGYKGFASARRVLDIAGGLGHFLLAILQAHPHLHGAVFDLPHMREPSSAFLTKHPAGARAAFQSGSFLEALPDGFDLYMIKNALWNWEDKDVVRIMANVRRAAGETGARLLIVEALIRDDNAADSTLFDLQMLVAPGGRCRTPDEYQGLARAAGWKVARLIDVQSTQILELESA